MTSQRLLDMRSTRQGKRRLAWVLFTPSKWERVTLLMLAIAHHGSFPSSTRHWRALATTAAKGCDLNWSLQHFSLFETTGVKADEATPPHLLFTA